MILYTGKISEKNKRLLQEFINEFEAYFELKVDLIDIVICRSRADFDRKVGIATPKWMVGHSTGNCAIVLCPESLEKESTHKNKEFLEIVKHEICHIFIKNVSPFCPRFFNEGLCLNFAGQNRVEKIRKENFDLFFDGNFFTTLNQDEFVKRQGYQLSYMVVKNILNYYSKNKLFKLLKISRQDTNWKQKIEDTIDDDFNGYKKMLAAGIIIDKDAGFSKFT